MKRIRIANLHPSSGLPLSPETEGGDFDMTPPDAPSYIERMAEQRRRWKAADAAKFYSPDRDPEAEKVWVVYAWVTPKSDPAHWLCLGEKYKKPRRRKPMTMNRLFAGIRTQFGLPKETPVLLISRQDDRARIRRHQDHPAPKHHDTLRPHKPPAASLKLVALTPTPKRKVRKDTAVKVQLEKKTGTTGRVTFTFKTRYVAWGRMPGRKWFFLGPAADGTKKGATTEIKNRFPIYSELVVMEVKSLKYSLRSRIMDGRLRAGVSKDTPPEER